MARCLLRYGRVLELSERTGLWIEAVTVRGGGTNAQKLYLHGGAVAYRDPRTGEIEHTADTWAEGYERARYRRDLERRRATFHAQH